MANTVTILDYTNTFADWLVNTNALARENNDFAANNYVKPTGTLFLNEPTLGLQVANSAIIAGQLQVQGIGSSAFVQNNLRVSGQAFFDNPTLGLTNTGQAIFNGRISANGSNNGIVVANNALVGGSLTVGGFGAFSSNVRVATSASVGSFLNVTANTTIGTNLSVGDIAYVGNKVYTDSLDANTSIFTPRLNASQGAFVGVLQAFASVNTEILTVTQSTFTNTLQANTSVDTNALLANTAIIDTAQANTLTVTNKLDANGALNAYFNNLTTLGQLSVGGNFVLSGTTVYNSNTFVLNSGSSVGTNSQYVVNRGLSGANASIYWEEIPKTWKILNVDNGQYYRILTDEHLSNSSSLNSTLNVATSAAVSSANTFLQANVGSALASARSYTDTSNTSMRSYVDVANTSMKSYVDVANTSMKSYVDNADNSLRSYVDASDAVLSNRANGLVQTAFVNVSANGVTLTATSNTDTLTITAATANGINVLNPASKTISIGLRNSGVSSGTYGNTTSIPSVTVDSFGRITSISNNSIVVPPGTSIIANSGQLTANSSTGTVALGLATTGVSSGQYGSASQTPVITVDTFGRITSLNTVPTTGSTTTTQTFLPNAIIFANSTGFLTNTSQLLYATSNNTIIAPSILLNGTLQGGVIKNTRLESYSESVNVVNSITTTTYTIDLSASNIFDLTLNNNVTFTFSNAPSAGVLRNSTIILRQGSSGNRLATFTGARYTDGITPVLSTGVNQTDVLTFFTVDGGITYFGTFAMANVS